MNHQLMGDSTVPSDPTRLMERLYEKAIDAYSKGLESDRHATIFTSLVGEYADLGYDNMMKVRPVLFL